MTGEQAQATLFERGSNVLDYWLANAEGFHVVSRRRPRRRVDHVVVDRELGEATMLVVRRTLGRRPRRIPVLEVAAVDPFERLLYLESPPRFLTVAARGAHWVAPRVVTSARLTRRQSVGAARWLGPRVVATAHWTGRRSLAAGRWVHPRAAAAGRRAFAASRLAASLALPVLCEAMVRLRAGVLRLYRGVDAVVGIAEVREDVRRLRPLLVAAARRARDVSVAMGARVSSAANAVRSARSSS